MDHDATRRIFQDRLGYHFKDQSLLVRALSHSSVGVENYERLEFLGDRVLGLIVADIVYHTFANDSEGALAKRQAALASTETLASIARFLDIGEVVILSESERSVGGMHHDNLLADSLEAILGAIYLDTGLESCREVIQGLWGERVHVLATPPLDSKTGLQEWAQARKLPLPVYEMVKREGADHAPLFHISVTIEGYGAKTATGSSRRTAEKEAARQLLDYLEDHHWMNEA
jgi:ribonuclease III